MTTGHEEEFRRLFEEEALQRLGALDIRGADVVEVSPPYDHANITAIAGATVAMYLLALRGEKVAGSR